MGGQGAARGLVAGVCDGKARRGCAASARVWGACSLARAGFGARATIPNVLLLGHGHALRLKLGTQRLLGCFALLALLRRAEASRPLLVHLGTRRNTYAWKRGW